MLSSVRFAVHRSAATKVINGRTSAGAARLYTTQIEGQAVPDIPITENSPGNSISLKKEIEKAGGTAVIVGVPGAFTPTCSASHVPGYVKNKDKLPGPVFVLSVNDPFVMKAWQESIEGAGSSGIRFVADQKGEVSKALGTLFPSANIFGTDRTKRFAMLVKDNKIQIASTEPDNTGLTEATSAEGLLKLIKEKGL